VRSPWILPRRASRLALSACGRAAVLRSAIPHSASQRNTVPLHIWPRRLARMRWPDRTYCAMPYRQPPADGEEVKAVCMSAFTAWCLEGTRHRLAPPPIQQDSCQADRCGLQCLQPAELVGSGQKLVRSDHVSGRARARTLRWIHPMCLFLRMGTTRHRDHLLFSLPSKVTDAPSEALWLPGAGPLNAAVLAAGHHRQSVGRVRRS
jgi:hypothetical protein